MTSNPWDHRESDATEHTHVCLSYLVKWLVTSLVLFITKFIEFEFFTYSGSKFLMRYIIYMFSKPINFSYVKSFFWKSAELVNIVKHTHTHTHTRAHTHAHTPPPHTHTPCHLSSSFLLFMICALGIRGQFRRCIKKGTVSIPSWLEHDVCTIVWGQMSLSMNLGWEGFEG